MSEFNVLDEDKLQLIFPVKIFFLFGSPLGMFVTTYFEESYVRDRLPTCEDFYNVFHPSDCIAYRLEPLVRHYNY